MRFTKFFLMSVTVTSLIPLITTFYACKASTNNQTTSKTATSSSTDTDTDTDTESATNSDTGTDTGTEQIETLAVNALAGAYPEGLAMSALPQVVPQNLPTSLPSAAGTTLAIPLKLLEEQPPANNQQQQNADKTIAEKIQEASDKLAGDVEKCADANLFKFMTGAQNQGVSCYSPDGDFSAALDTTTNEACSVATGRSYMSAPTGIVDNATGLVVAMMCQAKKDGIADSLPEIGKTLDLKTSMQTATVAADNMVLIDNAEITRLDDENGRAIYLTSIGFHRSDDGMTFVLNLRHSPSTEGNLSYDGRLWMTVDGPNMQQKDHISIPYTRSGTEEAPLVKYGMLQAEIDKLITDSFLENGALDINKHGNFSLPANDGNYGNSSGIAAVRYIGFDMNPITNEGKFMFWNNSSGNYGEAARGIVFEITKQEDSNALAGCSITGAAGGAGSGASAGSIRDAQKRKVDPTHKGYYHPQNTNPTCDASKGECQFAAYVYKQCFKQTADGKYEIDTTKTTAVEGFEIVPVGSHGLNIPEMGDISVYSGLD